MKAAMRIVQPEPTPRETPKAAAMFLEAADRIGRRLCRDALWAGDRCTWLGWSMEPVRGVFRPVYRAAGPSLYDGTAGTALFLAHLYRFTGDPLLRATRDGAVRQLLSQSPASERLPFSGYYSGTVGIGHTLARLGELCEDARLIERGLALVDRTAAAEIDPAMLDLLGGVAGAIPVLLDLADRHRRPALLETAGRYGEALLSHAAESAEGVSWSTLGQQGRNLTGLSHGTAGIACALLELHRARPDPRLLEAARGALRYERTHFSSAYGNWPDFRQMPGLPQQGPSYPVAWCHGAGGIGLSRLRALELLPEDAELLAELDTALRTVQGFLARPLVPGMEDFTFCHGAAGNAELLLQAADQLDRPDLRAAAEQVGRAGIDLYQRPGLPWPCGVPGAGETHALMVGTAGIGLFYLRLHDSKQVPSVLLVRPGPRTASPELEQASARSRVP